MNWTQIEKEFDNFVLNGGGTIGGKAYTKQLFYWMQQRIESELPPQPPEKLNEEERNEFYTTNVTAEIKPKYGA